LADPGHAAPLLGQALKDALNGSPRERQALLGREFWKDYITHKNQDQFEAFSQPFQDRLAARHADFEADLIQAMTQGELAEHSRA
jgi:hypothetical protein